MNVKSLISDYRLPLAYIFSQYSNSLTTFLTGLVIASLSVKHLAVYGICMALYTVLSQFAYGTLTSIGVWGANNESAQEFEKIIIHGFNISLICGVCFILVTLNVTAFLKPIVHDASLYLGIKDFYAGFSIGIIPHILVMLLIQIFSALNMSSLIIIVRSLKLFLIPLVLFVVCEINKSVSLWLIGFSLGLCYILIFVAAFTLFSLGKNKLSLSRIFFIFKRNLAKKELFVFFKIIRNGASSGLQITLENIYSLIILVLLSRIGYNVQSIYYVLTHLIYLFGTLPLAVSLALSFKSASNGLVGLKNTETYCKKLLYILIPVTLFISLLILLFKNQISSLFPVVKSILNNENYFFQYNIGYNLIPIVVILEIPRFFLIGLLRGLKITFVPMLANAGIFFIFSIPLSTFLVRSHFPVLYFLLGEIASLCIIIIILSKIYARTRKLCTR